MYSKVTCLNLSYCNFVNFDIFVEFKWFIIRINSVDYVSQIRNKFFKFCREK